MCIWVWHPCCRFSLVFSANKLKQDSFLGMGLNLLASSQSFSRLTVVPLPSFQQFTDLHSWHFFLSALHNHIQKPAASSWCSTRSVLASSFSHCLRPNVSFSRLNKVIFHFGFGWFFCFVGTDMESLLRGSHNSSWASVALWLRVSRNGKHLDMQMSWWRRRSGCLCRWNHSHSSGSETQTLERETADQPPVWGKL